MVGYKGNSLFVADIGAGIIYRYRIDQQGQLVDRRLFANDLADGMTVDEQGNLYLAGKGITVYDSTGNRMAHYPVPEPWTANCCFGGSNHDILFITASRGVYILPMKLRGAGE